MCEIMDYTKIRQLIYRERKSLDEFDVLAEEKNILVNAFLYDRILKIGYLHPMYDYANEETLRIFNDVHFFMTLFFHDENPLAHYADYRRIPNPNQQKDEISQNRTWVVLSMIYVILERWNRTKWFKKNLRYVKFFEIIKGEVENYTETWMGSPSEDIAHIITDGCDFRDFIMTIDHDFSLCNIQEVIDSEVSLKSCLAVGTELCNVVNDVCKDEKQKLALIDRLLEPEKEHYGVMDSTICAAYRCLYELKSKLTGEPLPEKLPFEKASTFTPPMMPTPSSVIECQSNEEDEDDEEDVDEEGIDDRDEIISELTEKVNSLTDEVNRLSQENSELRKKIADGGETEWIGCFDGFLHSSLDAKAIADALNNISSPHLPKNERSYWWVFYVSLLEINWILDSANHNTILKWVNLHFNLGWDWRSEQLFKFTIDKKYKVKHSSEWEMLGTTGKYYAELSKRMKDTFVKNYEGKLFDRKKFVLPECKSPNKRVTKE